MPADRDEDDELMRAAGLIGAQLRGALELTRREVFARLDDGDPKVARYAKEAFAEVESDLAELIDAFG